MSGLAVILPLLAFVLALLAYYTWGRASEAKMDARLQKQVWDTQKYHKEYKGTSPLEASEYYAQESKKFVLLTCLCAAAALICAALTLYFLLRP